MKQKDINSTKLREGLFHKISEIMALVLANLLEYVEGYLSLGIEIPLMSAVAVYLCLTELVSILENLGEVNPTLKNFYGPYLEKLHGKVTENESRN